MAYPSQNLAPDDDYYSESESDDGFSVDQALPKRFRQECNDVLKRLFPEDGADSLGDWNKGDVLKLTTIFQVARAAREAGVKTPWLSNHTILRVINKLSTGSLFNGYGPDGLVDLEHHLRLMSVVLRLYQYDDCLLEHNLLLKLFTGIQTLSDAFEVDRRKCPPEKQIENRNVAFLIYHCQNLLLTIKDSELLGWTVAKKAMHGVNAAVHTYGKNLGKAQQSLRELARFQRPVPKWHAEFVKLEDLCFTFMARKHKVRESQGVADQEVEFDERGTAIRLCDGLERMLVARDTGKFYSALGNLQKGFGKATQVLFDSGVYEENGEYCQYGIMDLMHQVTYYLETERSECLSEFIRVIRSTLERSHAKANSVHRKAIELYRRIDAMGEADRMRYGEAKDCKAIEAWLRHHRAEVEPSPASAK
jgi:hypothetical protein